MAALLIQKRACREKTLQSSEGRTLSGCSVVSKAHRNKRREQSSWSEGKELPGYPSVGVQAAQRQRSSVEQGI